MVSWIPLNPFLFGGFPRPKRSELDGGSLPGLLNDCCEWLLSDVSGRAWDSPKRAIQTDLQLAVALGGRAGRAKS